MEAEAMPAVRTPSAAAGGTDGVVGYLARTGAMYEEHKELLRRQKEAQERAAAPFRPSVTAYAEELYRTSSQRQSETIEERLHHLHQRKLEREQQQRERQAAVKDAAESAVSFKPVITAKAARLVRRDNVVESTHRWERVREQKLADRQAELARDEQCRMRARPKITAFAQEMAIAERSQDISIEDHLLLEEEKRRRRQYALTELHWHTLPESLASAPMSSPPASTIAGPQDSFVSVSAASVGQPAVKWFSPAISAYAAKLQRPGSVSDRLYRTVTDTARESSVYDETYGTHCTFAPKVSEFSRQLSRSYYDDDPDVRYRPVYERLYLNPKVPSKHRSKAIEPAVKDHQPQVSATSRALVQLMRERDALERTADGTLADSPGTRLHRTETEGRLTASQDASALTAANTEQQPRKKTFKKRVVTAKEREEMEELTFKPKVSDRSQQMWARRVAMLQGDGRVRSAEEARSLLWRTAGKHKADEVQRQRALRSAEEMLECTFQPEPTRAPAGKFGYDPAHALSVEERTLLWEQQKQRRLERLRSELAREKEEQEDCTFQPSVHATFPLPRRKPPAAGEDSFLSRQEDARRRRDEMHNWWRPHGPAHRPRKTRHTSIDGFRLGRERLQGQDGVAGGSAIEVGSRSSRASSMTGTGTSYTEEHDAFRPHYPRASSQHWDEDEEDEEDEEDDAYAPPAGGTVDRDLALPHQLPLQPHSLTQKATVHFAPQRSSSPEGQPAFRAVPATARAEQRKPSPLDAYRA